MPIFSDIGALLRAPVGNNLENRDDDVKNVKTHYAAVGKYKRPVENGIIDTDLDDAIFEFQKENKLKIDRIMNPGGETEATLIGQRIGLPDYPKPKEDEGYEQASAVPIFRGIGTALGMSAAAAAEWWKNLTTDEREKIAQSLDHTLNNNKNEEDKADAKEDAQAQIEAAKLHCDELYEDTLDRCKEVEEEYGKDAARICKETAMTAYSQCLKGVPEKDRRIPQTRF